MSKIDLDKYYTPSPVATECIAITKEVFPNITSWLEPSAGNGSFSLQLPDCLAYDISPEHETIEQQDFLTLQLPYQKGRCVIGNPPFGTRNTLSVKFFKKATSIADYIGFILPVSQYKNNQQMFEFDLVHSELLPEIMFSGIKVKTVFNLYSRPKSGYIHQKPKDWRLKDVTILEYRRGGSYSKPTRYDYGMCTFGNIGAKVNYVGEYCQENYFQINNERFREDILAVLQTTNWKTLYPSTTTAKIQTWKLYKYLKEQIPNLN